MAGPVDQVMFEKVIRDNLSPEGVARLDMIEAATREVAENMRDGALIILRSTVKIGTTRDVVSPILEASGKAFSIAMCPERTLEGRALQELRELPQIIGADRPEVADRAAAVFRPITSAKTEGTTSSVANVDITRPPITARPRGA